MLGNAEAPTDQAGSRGTSLGAPPVVIFDFDGTLVSRDSFFDFSRRYCARRPARLLLVTAVLPLALLLILRSSGAAGSVLLWAMTLGSSTRGFALALRRYAHDTLPDYANDAIFDELSRHVREGSRVLIATGSVPLVVRALLRARQAHAVSVVGSRLRRRWGGLVAETHCIGRVKVRELERRHGIVEWGRVYTDSLADSSLMRGAKFVHLVSPSGRTLERVERLIGRGATLQVLRPSRG